MYAIKFIRYRDSKGHFSKFTTKKKLSVEPIIKTVLWNKKKKRSIVVFKRSKKYSQPLRKRKRPVTVEEINNRVLKKTTRRTRTQRVGDTVIITSSRTPTKHKVSVKESQEAKRERQRIIELIMSSHKNL